MNRKDSQTVRPGQPAPVGPAPSWTSREAYLLALVCLAVGLIVGYIFRGSTPAASVTSAAAPSSAPAGKPAPASPQALAQLAAPLHAAVQANPRNVEALIRLGNFYFDNQAWAEAIEYYSRALELRPEDVNVRTDRGTAYWYSGFPDKAVEDYERSLSFQPDHANTLFNLGVVRLHGFGDAAGAVAAWNKLLQLHPQHPDRARIETLIAQARSGER
ncbi:MAG: tetratricopeptide repeat protein [Acidobacteriia bacterium]|nr:tetratricopeptide repeat protein [Terriglobia bacterium]